MTTNLYEKFLSLNTKDDKQFLIDVDCPVKVYYGVTAKGAYRLAFMSRHASNISGNTENIDVYSAQQSAETYWTCFDLNNRALLQSFCILGEDLISCINHESNELFALQKIKNRYNSWIKLLKKAMKHISKEEIKGLYGELYCLKKIIAPKVGYDKAIHGWGGPDNLSKDFSIDDTWYEIKTTGVASGVVKISSISQLQSNQDGHLIVVKVEEMSEAFDEENSSINKLCQSIISDLNDDELKDVFLCKLMEKGSTLFDEASDQNFEIHGAISYLVNSGFPSLKLTDEQSETIRNANYELILDKINDYIEEEYDV